MPNGALVEAYTTAAVLISSNADAKVVFQAAEDAVAALGGGNIYAHSGDYTFSGTLTHRDGVSLRCAGMNDTLFVFSDNTADAISVENDADFFTLSGFRVYFATQGTGDGIVFGRTNHNVRVEDVQVDNAAIGIYGQYYNWMQTLVNVRVNGCATGFYYYGLNEAAAGAGTTLTLINCYANSCSKGFRIEYYNEATLINCAVDGCTVGAYEFLTSNVTLIAPHAEAAVLNANFRSLFKFSGNTTARVLNPEIAGCDVAGGVTEVYAFNVDASSACRVVIDGITMENTGTVASWKLLATSGANIATSYVELGMRRVDVTSTTINAATPTRIWNSTGWVSSNMQDSWGSIKANQIDERSNGAGLTIDGVLLKDGKVAAAGLPDATTAARGAVLRAAALTATDPAGGLSQAAANATPDAPALYAEGSMQTELDKLKANDDALRTALNAAVTALNEEIARRKDVEAKLVTAGVLT